LQGFAGGTGKKIQHAEWPKAEDLQRAGLKGLVLEAARLADKPPLKGMSGERQAGCDTHPFQGTNRSVTVLLFVIERLAVGPYLNFRFLPVGFHLSLVGHQLVLLGEGLDLQNFSLAGLGLQSRFDFRRE